MKKVHLTAILLKLCNFNIIGFLQDALQGHQSPPLFPFGSNPLFSRSKDDDEVISDDEEISNDEQEDSSCPMIQLTKEEKMRLKKPWKHSLIIKMFDKNAGYMQFVKHLKQRWNL